MTPRSTAFGWPTTIGTTSRLRFMCSTSESSELNDTGPQPAALGKDTMRVGISPFAGTHDGSFAVADVAYEGGIDALGSVGACSS